MPNRFSHISRYERGISGPTADALKRLADVLGVTGDYLLEGSTEEAAKAHFEDREFLIMFKELEKLPEKDKDIIKTLIEAFLARSKIQKIVHPV